MVLHRLLMDAMGFTRLIFPTVVGLRKLPFHYFLLEAPAYVAGDVVVVVATTPIRGDKAVAAVADCACKPPFSATQK